MGKAKDKPGKLVSASRIAAALGWSTQRVRSSARRHDVYSERVGRDVFLDGEAYVNAVFADAPTLRDQALSALHASMHPAQE